MWLKQSTAAEVVLGPFVDSTDGFTPETTLTITQSEVRLKKTSGDWAQKNESTSPAHEENGYYRCLLDATDTNTLGILEVAVNETGALPVWKSFEVVAANVFDALIGGGDLLQVDVQEIEGDSQSSIDLKDFADAGYDPATNKVQGVVLVDSLGTDALSAASVSVGAAEKIIRAAAGTADSTTTTTVTDAERTEADTDYWKDAIIVFTAGPAIGQPRRISAFNAGTDVITVDTAFTTSPGANTYIIIRTAMQQAAGVGATDWSSGERDQIRHRLGIDGAASAPAATPSLSTAASVAGVQSDTDDIQSRLPAALVGGRMDSSVGAMASAVITAAALSAGAVEKILSSVSGTVDSGSTTTIVDAERTETPSTYWVDAIVMPTSGANAHIPRRVSIFNDATDTLTVDAPWPSAMAGGDTYIILRSSASLTLTNSAVAADAFAAANFASGFITSSKFASNAITTAAINNAAFTGAKFATGFMDATKFAADAIDSAAIAASGANKIRDAVWALAMTELAAVPGVTASVLDALRWVFLLSRNKITQTATQQKLRNDADGADVGTAAVSDDGTTFTRGEFA